MSDGDADVVCNLLYASEVTTPSPFPYITGSKRPPDSFSGYEWEKPPLLCVWRFDGKVENVSLCTQSLPRSLFLTQSAAITSPPHLQQYHQPENALIWHRTCQYRPKTCCFQAFPTPSCPTGQIRLQTRPLATTLFPIHSELVHMIATRLTQTFQNTVSLFISLSDKVKRRASGPTPPVGLVCKGHLRSHVLLFVCFRNINKLTYEGPNDSTTRSATKKPCTDHTDFFGGWVVCFKTILIFSHQCRTITCLQCRRNILWSMICCKSQFKTIAYGGLFSVACRIYVFISNFSMELWKLALILLFSCLRLSYSPALCSTRVTNQVHKRLALNVFHTGSRLMKLQGLIKLTLW